MNNEHCPREFAIDSISLDGSLQKQLRALIAENSGSVPLQLTGLMTERVELICDFSEAQAILSADKRKHTTGDYERDTVNDRYQTAIDLIAGFVQERSTPLMRTATFSIAQLLQDETRRLQSQELDLDLAADLIYPVLVKLMNALFEIERTPFEFDVPLVLEYLNDSPQNIINHFRTSIDNSSSDAPKLIRLLLSELDAETSAGALAMFLGVSVAPMANLCIFGILANESEKAAGVHCDPRRLFEKVCRETSPIFPGIFRDLGASRRNVLIPATWPGEGDHFTFGFGKHKCPGRGLSAHVFREVLGWWQLNDIPLTKVNERDSFPFAAGPITISLRSDNE